ncbi:MAG: hypothetical protein WBL44_13270 [Nitrososphaeraceae archaeon]
MSNDNDCAAPSQIGKTSTLSDPDTETPPFLRADGGRLSLRNIA